MNSSLNKTALMATVHCLVGCGIGEVLGMILSTWWGWGATASVVLSIGLAFVFGYGLSMRPLLGALSLSGAFKVALAADTLSITTMEIVDNGFILVIPGAIHAGLNTWLFWWSLGTAMIVAGLAAFPVNRWLIARGQGHAVMHQHHGHH